MRKLPAIATIGLLDVAVLPCAGPAWATQTGPPGRAPAGHLSCGTTILVNTKLDRDLVNCPDNGIVIGADDITLDLNGHVIDGDGAEVSDYPPYEPCDLGVLTTGHNGITIKGGAVRQFTFGVIYDTADAGRLSRLDLSDNLWSGSWSLEPHRPGSTGSPLTRNIAIGNHDLGIEAVAGVTDGGGNRALGNGNPAKCTNVSCR